MSLLRRRMMMQEQSGRPALRSNLAGWITTSFNVTEDMVVEYEYINHARGTYPAFCSSNMLNVEGNGAQGWDVRIFGNIRNTDGGHAVLYNLSENERAIIKLDLRNGETYKNGNYYRTVTVEDGIEPSPLNLFRAKDNARPFDATLFYFNFYQNDELVHSLVPHLDEDGITCIKDEITGEIYYNENTSATVEFLYEII